MTTRNRARRDREDELFSKMPKDMPKGSKVAIAKSRGLVKQVGKHLEMTKKGDVAVRHGKKSYK